MAALLKDEFLYSILILLREIWFLFHRDYISFLHKYTDICTPFILEIQQILELDCPSLFPIPVLLIKKEKATPK